MQNDFLPITPAEMRERGWKQPDFVYVTGDAYVDHPSFGAAIITRLLESQGFKVVVLSQPDWHSVRDFQKFGRPKYAFLITAGNIDSMVAHYTAAKKLRHDDAYTAGGKHGKRPDRAVNVYTRLAKEAYPDCPVILGGLEASLRRFAHYDYWDDAIRPSALVDSGADLLIYGMGEKQITEIARACERVSRWAVCMTFGAPCMRCPPKTRPLAEWSVPPLRMCVPLKRNMPALADWSRTSRIMCVASCSSSATAR